MARVLALLGAILLVAAALVARSVLDDESDDDGDGRGAGGGSLAVACIPELEEACEAIDRDVTLTIEDPAETIARIADGDDVDAWITLDPWPAMAPFLDDTIGLDTSIGVASTDLRLMVRDAAVPAACDAVTWTCLVDELGDQVTLPDPDSALGRLAVAFAANDFFPGFAANELRDDTALQARLAAVGFDRSGPQPFEDMLVLPDPDATAITAAAFERAVASRPAGSSFSTAPGASPATVAVVVAGEDADGIAGNEAFTDALADLGWDLRADAATTGLPNAGVLVALQEAVG